MAEISALISNIEKVIVGKRSTVEMAVCAMLTGGHILLEDVPGVGKTQLAASLARSVDGQFNRIQMTPDIMPSDIIGFDMIDKNTGEFTYKKGAAFCNFLLADEINRASPKSQSALLEVMEEHQISLDGKTFALPEPFMVIATQNPVETYGTYHLPEAQMDRFALKLSLGYPSVEEEYLVLERTEKDNPIKSISAVMTTKDICEMQERVKNIFCIESLRQYIIAIVAKTRESDLIKLPVSPRGSIALLKISKALAFVNGRDFVTPDDIKRSAVSVLCHRIILSPKGKASYGTAEAVLNEIISHIPVPSYN